MVASVTRASARVHADASQQKGGEGGRVAISNPGKERRPERIFPPGADLGKNILFLRDQRRRAGGPFVATPHVPQAAPPRCGQSPKGKEVGLGEITAIAARCFHAAGQHPHQSAPGIIRR